MAPVLKDQTAPFLLPPLVVNVCVEFTDPVIRSRDSRSYSSSQSFSPTDEICAELLDSLRQSCEELITRKDPRALERCHDVTLLPKRRRYRITFTILRHGSHWTERSFKSFQRQPLTVGLTQQVMLAAHRMVQTCLEFYDKDFRCSHGIVHPELGIVNSPVTSFLDAADIGLREDNLEVMINRTRDSELRRLELQCPTWSIREPIDIRTDPSSCRPTIETVLERGHIRTARTGVDPSTMNHQLQETEHRQVVDGSDTVLARTPPFERPLPRQWCLLNGPSQSLGAKEDLAPRNIFKHSRATSVAVSTQSQGGTSSNPRAFPLVPRKSFASSRRNTVSLLSSGQGDMLVSAGAAAASLPDISNTDPPPLGQPLATAEDLRHDELQGHGIPPETEGSKELNEGENGPSSAALSVDAIQQLGSRQLMEEQAVIAWEPKLELQPSVILARDAAMAIESPHHPTPAGKPASPHVDGSATPVDEKQHEMRLQPFDDFAACQIDVLGTDDHPVDVADANVHDHLPTGDTPAVSTEVVEHETTTAPSTPALSAGSDSSPRYSISVTPTMLRTQALVNDNILAVSSLDYAREEPSSPAEEIAGNDVEVADLHIHDLGRCDRREPPLVTELDHNDLEYISLHNIKGRNEYPSDVVICDAKANGEADKHIVGEVMEEDHMFEHLGRSVLEGASMTPLPPSPPTLALKDLDSGVLGASMVALPLSPASEPLDEAQIHREDTEISHVCEATFFCLDLEENGHAEREETEIHADEPAVETASLSKTIPAAPPADLQLSPSPATPAPEDCISHDKMDTHSGENERTPQYNEELSAIANDRETLSELQLHSSPEASSTEGKDMSIGCVDVDKMEEAPLEIETGSVYKEEHPPEAEVEKRATLVFDTLAAEAQVSEPLPEEIELPPSPEPPAGPPLSEHEDQAVAECPGAVMMGAETHVTRVAAPPDLRADSEQAHAEESPASVPTSPPEPVPTSVEDMGVEALVQPGLHRVDDAEPERGIYSLDDTPQAVNNGPAANNGSENILSNEAAIQLPPLPETRALQQILREADVATGERSETSVVEDESLLAETSLDTTTASQDVILQELPAPLAPVYPIVDADGEVFKQQHETGLKLADSVDHEGGGLSNPGEPEDAREDSSEVVVSDAEKVQLSPSHEVQAEDDLDHEHKAVDGNIKAMNVDDESSGLGAAISDAEIEHQSTSALHDTEGERVYPASCPSPSLQEMDSDILSPTSDIEEEEILELDSDVPPIASSDGSCLGEDEPVLSGTNMVSIDARVRARSNASDLPSLFSPAISDWLESPDHITPEGSGQAEDAAPGDNERAAVLDQPRAETKAIYVSPQQDKEPSAASPFLTAREIPDPFDCVRPNDSVSAVDATEGYHSTFREPHTASPHTRWRQLTFPIPTPFSLRTTTFSASPPSPAVSTYSSSPRSSLSSARPSIDLSRDSVDTIPPARDSVDTIAPLPSDSPPSSPHAHAAETPHGPSTAGWLGVRGTSTRRFSMPLQHVWDPSSSERGSHTSRPGTPTSTATVRYASYKRRGERRRPRLSDLSPRPVTSGGVLETVTAEEHGLDGHGKGKGKGVASKFVMLFAGVEFAKKALGNVQS